MDFIIKLSLILTLFIIYSPVYSQISPGDLAEAHEFMEGLSNCTQCHELGKGPGDKKCLDCHTNIKSRIDKKNGLHYQMVIIDKKKCYHCHSEHAGRDYELIYWHEGKSKFNHSLTGYDLNGKHARQLCRECHNPANIKDDLRALEKNVDLTRTYLGLNKNCLSCHFDEHRGQLDKNCTICHSHDGWKNAERFDHNSAELKLTGKHKKVDCRKCHPGVKDTKIENKNRVFYVKYVGLKYDNCLSCHKDKHEGKFGNRCTKCHNTTGWNKISGNVDHSKTKFPLRGKHLNISCVKCHKSGLKLVDDKLVSDTKMEFEKCTSCHEDVHKNEFGADCTKCHKNSGWKDLIKGSFDHSLTKFPLLGLHIKVKCNKCHKTETKSISLDYNRCAVCHKDLHQKQFVKRNDGGKCKSCHNEQGFIPAMFTINDHAKTKFPLKGGHLAQPCVVCHKMRTDKINKKNYRNFVIDDKRCEACHVDVHFGQFSKYKPIKGCEDCHAIEAENMLSFNHNKDSAYPLIGAHKKVLCKGCHFEVLYTGNLFPDRNTNKYTVYKPLEKNCKACHTSEVGPLEAIK